MSISIPITDVWTPGTLTPTKIKAYKALENKNLIRVKKVHVNRKTDVTTFDYLSAEDAGRTHAALKKAMLELEHEAAEEQVRFAQTMWGKDDHHADT